MRAVIKNIINQTSCINTYELELDEPVTFQTGQSMKWKLPNVKVTRLFSIASPGGENKKQLEFTIRLLDDGQFTSHLYDAKVGDEIELTGPFGKYIFDPSDGHEVALIAGGSGISVLRSILRYVVDNGFKNKVHLLFGVLTIDDIVYKDELKRIADEHDNFTYSLVITEPHPDWNGRTGYVTAEMFDEDFKDYKQTFYICGPEPFIEVVEKILTDKKVPEEKIRVDRWTFYKTADKSRV